MIFDGQYVLTAAHCVDEGGFIPKVAAWFVNDIEVLYGSTNLVNADAVSVSIFRFIRFIC